MPVLSVSLLGPFEVRLDGEALQGFESVKVRALLAYLAVEAGHPQGRSALAGLLWPGWPEEAAQKNLRHTLYSLRKLFKGLLIIEADRQSITLIHGEDCQVDVLELERALAEFRGNMTADERPLTVNKVVGGLQSAVALHRGPFLDGFNLDDSSEFEAWILNRQEHHARQVLEALSLLADWHEKQGETEPAEAFTRRQIEIEPWREEAHCQLMRLLALQGRRSEALAQYNTCCRLLTAELQAKPSPGTTQLFEDIRQGVLPLPAIQTPVSPPSPATPEKPIHNLPRQLTSLVGRVRETAEVKNLLETSPLVTVTGPGGIGKTRLALQVAQESLECFADGVWLVDLASITDPALVAAMTARAVGMYVDIGPQAQESLLEYLRPLQALILLDNCEHLVEACAGLAGAVLSACPGVKLLATSREVLSVTGESIYPLQPFSTPIPDDSLEQLSQNEAVCLFVDRASKSQPGFALLPANAPAVSQICTQLDGIPLAIELAAAWTRLLPVDQISRRLKESLDFLRGASRSALPRHQTMRGCLDWSYNLLSQEEQDILQALSVFAGGWTLEAAEAVCGDNCSAQEGLIDLLDQLAMKSLVQVEHNPEIETRYRLLEPVRQYAWGKLQVSGAGEAVCDRHLVFYQQLAQEAAPHLRAHRQIEWMRRLERELANIRQALGWSYNEEGSPERLEAGLKLAADLRWFWHCRCRHEEGYLWLQRLLDLEKQRRGSSDISRSMAVARARAITAMAELSIYVGSVSVNSHLPALVEESTGLLRRFDPQNKLDLARANFPLMYYLANKNIREGSYFLENSIVDCKALGEYYLSGISLHTLGIITGYHYHDLKRAQDLYQEALHFYQIIEDRDVLPHLFSQLADLAYRQGDLEAAQSYEIRSRQIAAEIENDLLFAGILTHDALGPLAWRRGDYAQAEFDFQYTNQKYRKLRGHGLSSLDSLGLLALSQGDYAKAEKIFQNLLHEALERKNEYFQFQSLWGLGDLAWDRGETAQAKGYFQELAQLNIYDRNYIADMGLAKAAMSRGDWLAACNHFTRTLDLLIKRTTWIVDEHTFTTVELLACLALAHHKPKAATCLLGAADGDYQYNRLLYPPLHREMIEQALSDVRQALDEADFTTAWEAGQAMDLDQALAYALQVVEEIRKSL